jgi:hypothetical protein
LSFNSGYAARGVNYAFKSFMKLVSVDNFIKLFWCNLHRYQRIALSFDSGYATRGVNYTKKFYEIDFRGQFHQTFLV